jgi:stringent starvation protein B
MISLEQQEEIPCASCQSWNRKQKKFSCNPHLCKGLTDWMNENASLPNEVVQIQMHLPETAIQYVV